MENRMALETTRTLHGRQDGYIEYKDASWIAGCFIDYTETAWTTGWLHRLQGSSMENRMALKTIRTLRG